MNWLTVTSEKYRNVIRRGLQTMGKILKNKIKSLFRREWLLLNAISWREQVIFWWDDNNYDRFVLIQQTELNFYSAS
jgi:hypothetical protein